MYIAEAIFTVTLSTTVAPVQGATKAAPLITTVQAVEKVFLIN
jgi:hypothetical protein